MINKVRARHRIISANLRRKIGKKIPTTPTADDRGTTPNHSRTDERQAFWHSFVRVRFLGEKIQTLVFREPAATHRCDMMI